jgi:LuxR family maltose regulon positive regulatory protein
MDVRVLGALEIEAPGGCLVRLGPQQRRVFLALLLQAGQVLSGTRLGQLIWGEPVPEGGAATLRSHVMRLRRALQAPPGGGQGEIALVTTGGGYALRVCSERVDAVQFERLLAQGRDAFAAGDPWTAGELLRSGLRLWRGSALVEVADRPFALAEIARLDGLRRVALLTRIQADLALGRHGELVGELQGLLTTAPREETLRRHLALALYRSQRPDEAARICQQGLTLLLDQGLDSPQLQKLQRDILRGAPELDWIPPASPRTPTAAVTDTPHAPTPDSRPVNVPPPLIRAKLAAPVPRRLVSRVALIKRLTKEPPRKLTLVCAPAGSGKSSLLADWHVREPRLFGWLSLDQADNDPTRFWTYLVEAMRTVAPQLSEAILHLLRIPGVDLIRVTLPGLLNELTTLPHHIIIALNDYHLIENNQIHEQLGFLLKHLPSNIELVISTRNLPPLPLARLRAHGELLEINTAQLRFSKQEANELINEVLGLGLRQCDVTRLWQRTEGWVVGLYLAALTLREHTDFPAFNDAFIGDRHIFDYLAAEVLDKQPATVRSFLLQTSILEQLCGSLCDAVTAASDSPRMLDTIERSNLFLVPLDREGGWYRYHNLFAKLLNLQLRSRQPELALTVHRRAAAWYLKAGWVAEAIQHMIIAGEVTDATELISAHWNDFVQNGRVATVDAWLRGLADETLLGDARMCLIRGWTHFGIGNLDEILPWADASEAAPLPAPFRDGTTSIAAGVATLRASYWLQIGDMEKARRIGFDAAKLERTPRWRMIATNCAGTAFYWLGYADEAQEQLEQTLRNSREMPLLAIYVLGILALIHAERGEWNQAQERANAALTLSAQTNVAEYWMSAMAHIVQGKVLERLRKFTDAENAIARGAELARRGHCQMAIASALITLAQVRNHRGDHDGARRLAREADTIVQKCPNPGFLAGKVKTLNRELSPNTF